MPHNPAGGALLAQALQGRRGKSYWRSLDELADSAVFRHALDTEFPHFAELLSEGVDRRSILRLMGASLMLGGLAACSPEVDAETATPEVVAPEGIVPGALSRYSSAVLLDGYSTGVLVRHAGARPIKVDGNPEHPASLGATDPFAEAAVLDLYDPDRAQAVSFQGRIRSWDNFTRALSDRIAALRDGAAGAKLRILTGSVTSPLLTAQLAAIRAAIPGCRWHQWQAVGRDNPRAGTQMAFGKPLAVLPHLDRTDVLLAVGSDLFSTAPGRLRFARDFAARRDAVRDRRMSRIYAVESTPTLVGAAADHRFILKPTEIDRFIRALAAGLGVAPAGWAWPEGPGWQAAVLRDLKAQQGRALVHIGAEQPGFLHGLVHRINHALSAEGRTLTLIGSVESESVEKVASLTELVEDMHAGRVEMLLMLGGNPVFTAPTDLGFAEALRRVPFSVALDTYRDETGAQAQWHLPERHVFEQWTDARAYDGTATIVQPQVRPFYDGISAHRLLSLLTNDTERDEQALLRRAWQARWGIDGPAFEARWREALRSGVVADSAAPAETASLRDDFLAAAPPLAEAAGLTVLFRPDEGLWDGRFANNGWLQELPRPLSKLTWDNAALLAPRTAERLGLANMDVVVLRHGDKTVQLPAWILPGQAEDCITLPLGFGRHASGRVGDDIGNDVYPLRSRDALWTLNAVGLTKKKGSWSLATTQLHHTLTDDRPVRLGTLAAFLADPQSVAGPKPATATLYSAPASGEAAWGMTIDTGLCIGCNACVVACQAENNIPVVGKEQVLRGREMQWLRVDLYYSGTADQPAAVFQPVPCMHCEEAPCEVVCPVGATNHDDEGLNVMVYNRCVGTRFCSSNCPYKVRRFNYLDYSVTETRPAAARNAEVTVRGRGVMEKCTYCLQRIAAARIYADRENRPIADGEVVTACQAACPTQAIIFGNLADPASAVRHKKESPLDYALLGELNTRPRTTYAARLRNPNPDLPDTEEQG